jgi:hypothetical protein
MGGSMSTSSVRLSTPNGLCSGSAAKNSIQRTGERGAIGRGGKDDTVRYLAKREITMTGDQIAALFWKAVTVFGGVSIISVAISGFLAKSLADRSIERHKATLTQETERLKAELGKDAEIHKWKLKKSELLFEKEYAAAVAFFELKTKYEPVRRHPDMDWHEVRGDVMDSFGDAEKRIAEYVTHHGLLRHRISLHGVVLTTTKRLRKLQTSS